MAQSARESYQERREVRKMAKAELNAKVDWVTKREAKRLKQEGWQVMRAELEQKGKDLHNKLDKMLGL